MPKAILSLGSNLGERVNYIDKAINSLKHIPKLELIKISSYYETKPYGVNEAQNKYINCCLKINTSLTSSELLGVCLGIEAALDRKREYRFSPRTIDIDLIAYGNEIKNEENLILPHPRLFERGFVLIPLKEICPEGKFENLDFNSSFKACDREGINKINVNFNNFI